MTVLAVVMALLAAACYAVGAALQHQQAAATRAGRGMDPSLLWRLARRPRWLAGVLTNGGGTAFHAVALSLAPLALVQPLGVLTIVFAVPVNALLHRRRPGRAELAGATATAAGLALLAVAAHPATAVPSLHAIAVLPVLGVLAAVLGVAALAVRGLSGPARAIVLAAGGGIGFGVTSSLIRPALHLIGTTGPVRAVAALALSAGAAALTGLLLEQTAFQNGHLGLAVAVVTVADPVAALGTGALLLGQPAGLHLLPTAAATAAILTGVALLSRHHATTWAPAARNTGVRGTRKGRRAPTDRTGRIDAAAYPAEGSTAGPSRWPTGPAASTATPR